ncbi:hypothetical protein E1B28_010266 [Marasmius oreades]|uniref:BTB domain-containing protein n=1 Tax=Marasmius oreades TaxID=181124 RepID=A0A9P7RWX7_9AGAR|nr:uncharacterized protein E1B28_010266 [Marasmius oreades]KAG7091215.1 hypothetical protein E1B28_010266 [Marasmius oreades]
MLNVQKNPVPHVSFYVDNAVFQVDNTIFKVPSRYFHENSEAFGAASKISAGNAIGEGSSDANPIKLSPLPHGTKAEDFALLVQIVMSFTFNLPVPTNYTLRDWVSTLKLATAWEFEDIRTVAINSITAGRRDTSSYDEWIGILEFCWNLPGFAELRELAIGRVSGLQKWTPMQKIDNGRRYRVRQWVLEGLRELADAPSLPTAKEIESLGFQIAMNFFFLREEVLKRCSRCARILECPSTHRYGTKERCDLSLVEQYFGQELSKIEPPIHVKKTP